MGYTHYFYTKPTIPMEKWKQFIQAEKELLKDAEGLVFEYNQPNKKPVANTRLVRFNGIGNDGHETFYMERKGKIPDWQSFKRDRVFSFCKTAYKPYDVYVTASLILAHIYLGDEIEISSDGDVKDWQAGVRLVNRTVGKQFNFEVELKENPEAEYPTSLDTAIISWKTI